MNYAGASWNEQFKKLLEENLAYSKAIYDSILKIRRYIFWNYVINFVKLILIVIPIILAIIYLPPLIQQFFDTYKELLGIFQTTEVLQKLLP